jgi:hypothetical protein
MAMCLHLRREEEKCKCVVTPDKRGVSKKFGEWYQKTNKTEDTNKLTLLDFKITAILRNTLLAKAQNQGSTVGGLLSVSPPEEHHERRTFCRRGGNPTKFDSGSAIDS